MQHTEHKPTSDFHIHYSKSRLGEPRPDSVSLHFEVLEEDQSTVSQRATIDEMTSEVLIPDTMESGYYEVERSELRTLV